jgi:regulator of sigma E protease
MNLEFLCQLKNIASIALGLFGIGIIIGLHEFGHYLFARLFGVRAPSFSIGMGPKLISKKMWGTDFKISAIPLGGYVEIAGMAEIGQGEQKEAKARDAGSFQSKAYWQKALILMGGIIFNFILAFILFIGLYFTGMPKSLYLNPDDIQPIVKATMAGHPAAEAHWQEGDIIHSINNEPTPNILDVITLLKKYTETPVSITVERNKQKITHTITPDKTGKIGIEFKAAGYLPPESFIQSIKNGWHLTVDLTKKTFNIFGHLFHKRTTEGLGGPLMLVATIISSTKEGFSIFLFLLAFISINLGFINLIPLPITDGGQLVFATIEAIIRRPLPEKAVEAIHTISWMLVIALFAFLTFKDSKMLFWEKIKNLLGK